MPGSIFNPVDARGDGGFTQRNRILNPNGQVAQVTLASTADGAYTFDQWIALTQSNPVTPSQVSNAEDGTPFLMRLTQANAGAQRFGAIQWLEDKQCLDMRAQSVTLSARVRMSVSTTLRYAIVEWTGTANTITKDIVNDWTSAAFTTGNFFTSTTTTVTGTGSTALTSNTFATVTLTATVSSSANNICVFFWTDSTQAQNVTLDLARVQLELGASATTFSPPFLGEQTAACRRYYRVIGGDTGFQRFGFGFVASSTSFKTAIQLANVMRSNPTFSISAASDFAIDTGSAFQSATGISVDTNSSDHMIVLAVTVGSGLTAGDAGTLQDAGSNNARVFLNSRL